MTKQDVGASTSRIDAVRLRRIRESQELSQAEFATLVRKAGAELGELNSCNKRLIQKWESGDHATCRPNYRRALARVTGMTYAQLCEPLPTTEHVSTSADRVDGATLRTLLDDVIGQLAEVRERLGETAS